jgi:hypothetical protein
MIVIPIKPFCTFKPSIMKIPTVCSEAIGGRIILSKFQVGVQDIERRADAKLQEYFRMIRGQMLLHT